MNLTTKELERYSRHLNLPDFGIEAQERLKHTSVLVVGTGGLGAPLLQYLTAAGVGTIGVVDFDVVDESNLQRQVLFGVNDIGKPKSSVAINRLKGQNPYVDFKEFNVKLDSSNALDILRDFDVIADGTDNFPTRYLVNDACVLLGKPLIYASIYQFEGQVSVFNAQIDNGDRGPNYRDLFPTPPPPGMVPSCAEGGVLGVLPGIIGSLQANEVIKIATGIGESLSGRLFIFDALNFSSHTVKISKDPLNPVSGENPTVTQLIDYDAFCGITTKSNAESISVDELNRMKLEGADFILIDVREPYEYEAGNIGGISLSFTHLEENIAKIPKDKLVVVHCKSGGRSRKAIAMLKEKFGYENLKNLDGGMLAWKKKVYPELTVI